MRLSASKARAFLPLFGTVLLTDCVSKSVAVAQLSPAYVPHDVIGDFLRFTLAYNTKAAMGLSIGSQSRWFFAITAALALTAMVIWLVRLPSDDRLVISGLALVASGAVGNLVDRLRWDRGVVDFIDVGFGESRFYIFNVADAAITIGAIVLWFAMKRVAASNAQPAAKQDT
jgi:signal peptidase II